jgi:UDPglucose--hexose-1-phosphate uridylyltransferase
MAKYVPDVKTQRWVIISQARKDRPTDEGPPDTVQKRVCPFCLGNESVTPPEVFRIGGGEKDTLGWLVRVVPNKFPITDLHEVIIHSPDHDKDLEDLPIEQVTRVITAYRDRYRAHATGGQVLIFCNHGMHAGASLNHPHAQLVVVPKQINLDALFREPIANVIDENSHFITYCPEFSQWPFEVWIVPKEKGQKFGDLRDDVVLNLAEVLQKTLLRIKAAFHSENLAYIHKGIPFGYNFYISHALDWFIRIIPRFIHRAGFELGTGLNVNILDPTEAAEILKKL